MPFNPEADHHIRQIAEYLTSWLRDENRLPFDEFRISLEDSFGCSQTTFDFALVIATRHVLGPELATYMEHDLKGTATILINHLTHERVTTESYAERYGIPPAVVVNLAEKIREEHRMDHRRHNPQRYTDPEKAARLPFANNPTAGRYGHHRRPQE